MKRCVIFGLRQLRVFHSLSREPCVEIIVEKDKRSLDPREGRRTGAQLTCFGLGMHKTETSLRGWVLRETPTDRRSPAIFDLCYQSMA